MFPPRSAAVGKIEGGSADLGFRARHLSAPLGRALCRSQVCQPCGISKLITKVAREREGEKERKRKRAIERAQKRGGEGERERERKRKV